MDVEIFNKEISEEINFDEDDAEMLLTKSSEEREHTRIYRMHTHAARREREREKEGRGSVCVECGYK